MREVEIDCPSSCPYLKTSRSYELDKPIPDAEGAAKIQRFGDGFVEKYYGILDMLSLAIIEERMSSAWLVDHDVIEVLKALHETFKTLSGGIYYESLPDGPVRQALFRRLKEVLDELMRSDPGAERILKVSEALDILDFLTAVAQVNSSERPKSRRYLDWIYERYAAQIPAQPSSGLIIP
ncbi:MAG TPA: hypothetical protein VGK48_26770 [Terriglobia bacterium]